MSGIKYDSNKLRYDLVPVEWERALAEVMTYGATKYGDNNWQNLEGGVDRYYAAHRRHMAAYRAGELVDAESGISHLALAMVNIGMIMYHASRADKAMPRAYMAPSTLPMPPMPRVPPMPKKAPPMHPVFSAPTEPTEPRPEVSFLEGSGHD